MQAGLRKTHAQVNRLIARVTAGRNRELGELKLPLIRIRVRGEGMVSPHAHPALERSLGEHFGE